jgi:glycine hydroxymethyltransferase
MRDLLEILAATDPEVARAIAGELTRERGTLELIASENFTSPAVLAAQGSVFTNKYAEGYEARRYYGGCGWADVAEHTAIERAKRLFGAEHVNVQPHAGVQANMAVYFAALKAGDRVMGMSLAHGGHLSHGAPASFSGKLYEFQAYTVDPETEMLHYDAILEQAKVFRPRMIVAGASAYPRIIDAEELAKVAAEVGAMLMVDIAHTAGLVAGGAHPSPVPHADFVTSTTHKTLRGPRGGMVMCRERYAEALDKAVFPGMQGGPLVHVIAAKAVALGEALRPEFKDYAAQIVANAKILAETLSAGGFRLVTGGTDTHLILVDLSPKGLTGKQAEAWLEEVGLTTNKNAIPFDPLPPTQASGIRVGTPAMTTRGMREPEMAEIGSLIHDALGAVGDRSALPALSARVKALTDAFPLYEGLGDVSSYLGSDRAP